MKTVLLTGGRGLVGQHSLRYLAEKGFNIVAVTSQKPDLARDDDVRWVEADLLHKPDIDRILREFSPTHLLHFAWETGHGVFRTSMKNFQWLENSLYLFKKFYQNGGRRAVVAGTCFEYNLFTPGMSIENKTPLTPSPETVYGYCKNTLREAVDLINDTTDLSCAWGRIFYTFGEDEKPQRFVPHVVLSLLQNRPVQYVEGLTRDFLYAKDIAGAFVELLDSPLEGAVNIASGQGVSLKELALKIAAKLGKEELVKPLEDFNAPDEPDYIVADTTRLKNELGWTPKYSLDEALDRVVDYWRRGADENG